MTILEKVKESIKKGKFDENGNNGDFIEMFKDYEVKGELV